MAPREITANGARFRVEDRGKGPVLLLVHGFPLDHRMWEAQIEAFSPSHRVLAPDLRNFGRSEVTGGVYTMEDAADDLAGLLDVLHGGDPVVVCGLSMGGYISFAFWRRHAARVRALILMDTRTVPDTPQAAKDRLALAERVLREGTALVVDSMWPRLFAPGWDQRNPESAALLRDMMTVPKPEGLAAALRGLARRADSQDVLATINVPTLVLVGESDAISPVEEMRQIAAGISGSRFRVITGSGHMAPMEAPEAVTAEMRAFLGSVG